MPPTLLKIYFELLYRYQDPTDDRIIVDYFSRHEWNFDIPSLAPVETTALFSHDVGGPVDLEPNYSKPLDEEVYGYCVADTTTRRAFFHDGNGGVQVPVDEENSAACGYTPDPAAGTFLRYECRDANGALGGVDRYRITADGAGGEVATLLQANSPLCGYVPPGGGGDVPGCMDPEASNYDESATQNDGTCVYAPRLNVTAPARLAAVGMPLPFVLQSVPTGHAPTRARLLLTVASPLEAGTVLTINGESFTAVAGMAGVGEFTSGITLATALASSVTLTARYRIAQPAPDEVELVALATGSELTPTAAVSDEQGGVLLTVTAGVDELRSQARKEWGCYAEIWAVPGAVWGGADPDLSDAYLVDRLEQLYQVSNRYTFDLAPALLPLVGHSLGTSADRLVAYFVRFGEVYVPAGELLRRRLVVADTDVCWGLESALPVPAQATALPLSVLPPDGRLPVVGRAVWVERAYVLAPAGVAIVVQLSTRTVTGVLSTRSRAVVADGGVEALELGSLLAQLPAAALRSTLTVSVGGQPLLTHVLRHEPARWGLYLLSRRGTYEVIWFTGLLEPTPKRTVQLYAQGTSQAVRRVELSRGQKLASGPLSRADLDWLCDELAASPDVYLLDTAGQPAPVVVTAFAPDYNEPENRYSLTLDVEPTPPTYTLSN